MYDGVSCTYSTQFNIAKFTPIIVDPLNTVEFQRGMVDAKKICEARTN